MSSGSTPVAGRFYKQQMLGSEQLRGLQSNFIHFTAWFLS